MPDQIDFPVAPHLVTSQHNELEEVFDQFKTREFLSNRLVIQEKINGYSMTCHFSRNRPVLRHLGRSVTYAEYRDGFRAWVAPIASVMNQAFGDRIVLFGAWVRKRSRYRCPKSDRFLIHDMFDRHEERFWSASRIQGVCDILKIKMVPTVVEGVFGLRELRLLAEAKAKYGAAKIGSLYLRQEDDYRVIGRAQYAADL